MVTRNEAIEAGNKILREHYNKGLVDAYHMPFDCDIDSFLKTAILTCVKDSHVEGGEIKVKSPVELSVVLSAFKKLGKDGFIN